MALFDSMTVYENVALPVSENFRLEKGEIRRRVHEKMRQLDLMGIDDKYPSQISGGMKKRVALARALVTDPEIVLFDEPTTGLDPIRKNAVHSMISDYQRRFGFTGVVVSHEIPDIFYISQRVAMLNRGRIIFSGTPAEIQQSDKLEIQQFIHGLETRHDDLTGLPTQTLTEKKFEEEMSRPATDRSPFSLLMLTIENLDEINSRAGHAAGQAVLQKLSAQIRHYLRVSDMCSRYGLNQIIVLLNGATLDEARQFCERLTAALRRDTITDILPYPDFCFSISAGIVEAEVDKALEQLIARAESERNVMYDFRVC
jgi:phospholipid/cholesterol/gamma-HCH transport system ATP-binding protein